MIMTNAMFMADPFAPPRWKWEVAVQLFKQPDLKDVPEDQVTRDALSYLKTGDTLQFPEIHESIQIFKEDGLRRAELEARILVGQSDSEIAGFCKLAPEVVQVYADLFFCVREFPGASDWLRVHTVDKPHFNGDANHNLRQMWAWFALPKEPVLLNLVIQSYYDELKPGDEPTLSVYLRPTSSVDLKLQSLISEIIFTPFLLIDKWGLEFFEYFYLTQALPTRAARDRALQEYREDRIKYAYQFLKGKIKKQPPKRKPRKPRKTSPISPAREIRKIQRKLRSLVLSSV